MYNITFDIHVFFLLTWKISHVMLLLSSMKLTINNNITCDVPAQHIEGHAYAMRLNEPEFQLVEDLSAQVHGLSHTNVD